MRPGEKRNVALVVENIYSGTASQSDVSSLLTAIRWHVSADSMLRDLCDCVGHDRRNRGVAHAYLQETARQFRRGANGQSARFEVKIVYEIHALIGELSDSLSSLDIAVDRASIHRRSPLLCKHIGGIIGGTTVKIADADVTFSPPWVELFFRSLQLGPYPTRDQGVMFPLLYKSDQLP